GRDAVGALGLGNVALEALDVVAFPADAGEFDYIICHGVYSWVPAAARAAVLDLIARHLAPGGVAYVSHVVKPGWFANAAAREIMKFHTGALKERGPRIEQARAVMGFISKASPHAAWKGLMTEQRETVEREPDWLLHHDY